MKVFISWSGETSSKIAEEMQNWLKSVIQQIKPFFTPSDIDKGSRWESHIANELEQAELGILCLTRESIHSDWLLFEAGALFKGLEKSRVCTILFGIKDTDLSGPLKQFQRTEFNKKEMKLLIIMINNMLDENKLAEKTLDSAFNIWWPDLEQKINKFLEDMNKNTVSEPIRTDRDIYEETLRLTREISEIVSKSTSNLDIKAVEVILKNYIDLHNEQVAGNGGCQDILDSLKRAYGAMQHLAKVYMKKSPRVSACSVLLKSLDFEYQDNNDIPF